MRSADSRYSSTAEVDRFMSSCDTCAYYDEDEYGDFCTLELDEDEYIRFLEDRSAGCPYYKDGDEYKMVRKQN